MSDDEAIQADEGLSATLLELLGAEGYLLLLERYAGLRLYVPRMKQNSVSVLVDDITIVHAIKLSAEFGGNYIRVPLDRDFRALAYRQKGFSLKKTVQLLGVTESGLDRIWKRLKEQGIDVPDAPSAKLKVARDDYFA